MGAFNDLESSSLCFPIYDTIQQPSVNKLSVVGDKTEYDTICYPDDHKNKNVPIPYTRAVEIRTSDGNVGWIKVRFLDDRSVSIGVKAFHDGHGIDKFDARKLNEDAGYVGIKYLDSGIPVQIKIDQLVEVGPNVVVVEVYL